MKNFQKGFATPMLVAVIVILVVVGGAYLYTNKTKQPDQIPGVSMQQKSSPISNSGTPFIKVLSPNGGEKYEGGKTYEIKWSSNSTENLDIGLIEGSEDGGQGAGYIALDIPNSGNYMWTVSPSIKTDQYRIVIRPVGESSIEDTSDSTFTITTTSLILTDSEALALVKSTWGGCEPSTCSKVIVSVNNIGGVTYVTATYEGLRDDSSSASRRVARAHYDYGYKAWVLETPVDTQRCQPGRGHQDFSAEPCI